MTQPKEKRVTVAAVKQAKREMEEAERLMREANAAHTRARDKYYHLYGTFTEQQGI